MIAYLASDFIFLLLLFEIQNILRKEIAAKGHFSVWKMCVIIHPKGWGCIANNLPITPSTARH